MNNNEVKQAETKMRRPITITYDWLYNDPFGAIRRVHRCETFEEYHRVVRILHEHEDKYKVIKVVREAEERA